MSEMANRAMDKIRDEMAGTKNRLVQQIGEIMTELLLIAPELSEQILAEGKTCEGAAKHCKNYARRYCTQGREGEVATSDGEDAQCLGEYWEIEPENVGKAMLARHLREAMQQFGGKLPEGISFIGAEPQAHAENPSGASHHLPYRGEAVMGAGADPSEQGSLAGESAGSLLDDFDALLGGL